MNEEFRKELENEIEKPEWKKLKGMFDGKEYKFNGNEVVEEILHLPRVGRLDVVVQISHVCVNKECLKGTQFRATEFAGKVIKVGRDVSSCRVDNFVIGRDLAQNCFKEIVVTNFENIQREEKHSPNDLINTLGNMSTAVLPYETLQYVTVRPSDNVLILGTGVVAQKLYEMLDDKHIRSFIVVPDKMVRKYTTMGYNAVSIQVVDEVFVDKADVIFDMSNKFEVLDNIRTSTTYIYLNCDNPLGDHLRENETRVLSDVKGHATFMSVKCPSNSEAFFKSHNKAKYLLRPHIHSVVNIVDKKLVLEVLIAQQQEDETVIICL
ncbi:hypothetical protein EIN_031240 [Entamoeba invadens IP1]|uniref:Uncharacterized protein n=1 Tax=Entamoeba invadens IP1 TaxID=370355 RepID=A0A0A1U1E8_ENTIV|nr:hypothetical protein EIN_031240 [Entamoeba invadens IP1]ELP86423.1 hypothetical protein EIN_031240 [Entamoeba invadens IP1]|eukprot:XP_004185769.1 hypothetical protein EIN_031240 [Entamoeba invadens IP1]